MGNKKIINEHFDQIIKKAKIGDEDQILKIKEIKEINLHIYNQNKDNSKLKSIEDNSLEKHKKIDLIKEEIIKFDCVLLETPKLSNELILVPCFYNQKNLDFINKIFTFR